MKVSELKALLNEVPENLTQEQFDSLDVLIATDETHHNPIDKFCGVSTFGPNPGTDEKDLTFFVLSSDADVIER